MTSRPDLSDQQFHKVLSCLDEIKACVENSSDSDVIRSWQLVVHDFADDIHLIHQVHKLYNERLIEALSGGVRGADNFIGADTNAVECFRLGSVTWMIIEENLNKICNIQKEAACTTNQK